ncbi:MAG: FAD-dependent oxidoreductase [Acidobacteriales bacterium]|nr:FAD-dependent oxidoreductase [Terriglobales bacterium]
MPGRIIIITTADVIVVGGGVIGVCSAYYLAKSGRSVILLEQGEIASGCSYGNACLITPSHAVPLPAPGVIRQALKWMLKEDSPLLIRARLDFQLLRWLLQFAQNCRPEAMMRGIPILRDLCRASLALYEELVRTENLEFYFERRGALYVSSTDAGFEKSKREAELLAGYGFDSRILGGRNAHELEPAVLETVKGAVYYPEDAHGDSHFFVTGLGRLLPKYGVTIRTNTRALGLLPADGDRIAVNTDQGVFQCKDLLLAAGSWLPGLTRAFGVSLPIQPGKGYSVTISKPEGAPKIPVAHQERRVFVTPLGDRLRFAGTMEFAGMDLRMNNTRAQAALRGGREILLPFGEPRNIEYWCGLRPCTPDGIPVIGRIPRHPNVYVAAGHAMLGFTMGPITGKLASEMITGAPLSLAMGALSPGRFL